MTDQTANNEPPRGCSCHPDDCPPVPCPRKHALTDCRNWAYREFARWAVQEGPWRGCELDGGSIQDKAQELGIIKGVPYNPEEHGENEFDLEPGDPWFVFADTPQ